MCGILGTVIRRMDDDVLKTLYDIFINQKSRGLQGAGISVNNGGRLFRFRSISPFRLFNVYNYKIWSRLKDGSNVLVHHRYPTSSENAPKFNHPIANEDNTIHLIHNGVLMNEHKLYKELKGKHVFETKVKKGSRFTDTEVIVHVFEDAYKKGNLKDAIRSIYRRVEGSYALAMNIVGVDGIVLIRHRMPVIIHKDKHGNQYFSSCHDKDELDTTIEHTLSDGEFGILNQDGYKKLGKHKAKDKPFDKQAWYMEDAEFEDYDTSMTRAYRGY